MVRIVSLVLAVGFGLAAALLLVTGPTVHVDGESLRCPGIIVSGESEYRDLHGRAPDARDGACDRAERRWSWYAGGAALLCATAGSVALLTRRDEAERSAAHAGAGTGVGDRP